MKPIRLIKQACLWAIPLLLQACISDGGTVDGQGGITVQTFTAVPIVGQVTKGVVDQARVTVHEVNVDGTPGAKVLGPLSTGVDGRFSGTLNGLKDTLYLVQARGGSYVDEATSQTIGLTAKNVLIGILSVRNGAAASVTPLSHAVYLAALDNIQNHGLEAQAALRLAASDASSAFGFDVLNTLPVNVFGNARLILPKEAIYAAWLAGFSQMLVDQKTQLNSFVGTPVFDKILAMVRDISDGKQDGLDAAGQAIVLSTGLAGGTGTDRWPAFDSGGMTSLLASARAFATQNGVLSATTLPDVNLVFRHAVPQQPPAPSTPIGGGAGNGTTGTGSTTNTGNVDNTPTGNTGAGTGSGGTGTTPPAPTPVTPVASAKTVRTDGVFGFLAITGSGSNNLPDANLNGDLFDAAQTRWQTADQRYTLDLLYDPVTGTATQLDLFYSAPGAGGRWALNNGTVAIAGISAANNELTFSQVSLAEVNGTTTLVLDGRLTLTKKIVAGQNGRSGSFGSLAISGTQSDILNNTPTALVFDGVKAFTGADTLNRQWNDPVHGYTVSIETDPADNTKVTKVRFQTSGGNRWEVVAPAGLASLATTITPTTQSIHFAQLVLRPVPAINRQGNAFDPTLVLDGTLIR